MALTVIMETPGSSCRHLQFYTDTSLRHLHNLESAQQRTAGFCRKFDR